jgi:hypothetical protein
MTPTIELREQVEKERCDEPFRAYISYSLAQELLKEIEERDNQIKALEVENGKEKNNYN